MKLYVKRYSQQLTTEIEGFELPVELPDMPPRKEMVNYGLPAEKQFFVRTEVPKDLANNKEKEAAFVRDEWHKRWNGIWILIKGQPVYITGPAYVFFNYWHTEAGPLPDFRMEAVAWFQIWDMVLRSSRCYGILDIKGRRVGDTEKALFCGWELITRYRKSWFGMQNTTESDAWENFNRVVMSNRSMVYFFKPVPFDTDMPKSIMEFKFPAQRPGSKDKKRIKYDLSIELDSKIDYKATEVKKYDGKRLRFYHLDEPGKIAVSKMDIVKQWGIVKLCLTKANGKYLIGKAMLTTTVEQLGDGSTVEKMKELWDGSNPTATSEHGETSNGLWRWFRSYKFGADIDQYGHHLVEEATIARNARIEQLLRDKQFDVLTAYKRQFPATIEEALVPSEAECSFNAYLLDEQTRKLNQMVTSGQEWPTKPRRGNLEWMNGFGSNVRWIPDDNGRWEISQHPGNPNNRHQVSPGVWAPGNFEFAGGVDPIDHLKPQRDASNGAIAIGAINNPNLEPYSAQLEFDEHGNVTNPHMLMSDRCSCTYRNRPNNPYDFYDDVIKTVVYYGCRVNVETQKPGVINYMNQKGYGQFIANQPLTTNHKVLSTRTHRNMQSQGTPANTETIASYIEAIKVHVQTKSGTYTHMDLLSDMRQFTGEKKNRTERDLTVAWGWALVLMNSMAYLSEKKTQTQKWPVLPFKTYQHNNN